MIHYQLRCAAGHAFDGWFRDSATFDRQAAAGLVECPRCADTRVTRALMAPAIGSGTKERVSAEALPVPTPPPAEPPRAAGGPMPAQLIGLLQRLRQEVEARSDYVGPRLAEEARRIDAGEAAARSIYGEATDAEAEALAEDGIGFARIPWVPRAD